MYIYIYIYGNKRYVYILPQFAVCVTMFFFC